MTYSLSPKALESQIPEKLWILGAGKFGRIAVERLHKRYPKADFLIIDSEEEKLNRIHAAHNLPIHEEDAVSFLNGANLPKEVWVVPAVPVHVAFLWLLERLNRSSGAQHIPVPEAVDGQVPNPYRVESGTVYASFATFLCPDSCNEPDEICTHTKAPRPGNLFDRLAKIEVPGFNVAIMRSRQLAPGVGGYTGAHLNELFEVVAEKEGSWLIATSCRCHGVIDALKWNR